MANFPSTTTTTGSTRSWLSENALSRMLATRRARTFTLRVMFFVAVVMLLTMSTVFLVSPYGQTARTAIHFSSSSPPQLLIPSSSSSSSGSIPISPEQPKPPSSSSAVATAIAAAAAAVDWSKFAYVQYVTDTNYLCNSVLIFASLRKLGAKADLLMMHPEAWTMSGEGTSSRLLRLAKEKYGAKLQPIKLQMRSVNDPTWSESFTKLLAFNQTGYDRVIQLDSDATVLKSLDELFLLPPSPFAMPRAYWLPPADRVGSAQIMVIQPSHFEFSRVLAQISQASGNVYDMEIVNMLYKDHCMLLPHRPYNLLTGEYKVSPDSHERYLGSTEEAWDGMKVLDEAKYLHFSDWPVPKPWISRPALLKQNQPKCWNPKTKREEKASDDKEKKEDCRDRDIWLGFYKDFAKRRKDICGLDLLD